MKNLCFQVEDVPSTKLPIIIEALKLNAPAGVEVTIKKVCFHYFWDRPTHYDVEISLFCFILFPNNNFRHQI